MASDCLKHLDTSSCWNHGQCCQLKVLLAVLQDESLVVSLIQRHLKYTKSAVARAILNDWQTAKQHFVKVFPHEYARALQEKSATEVSPASFACPLIHRTNMQHHQIMTTLESCITYLEVCTVLIPDSNRSGTPHDAQLFR